MIKPEQITTDKKALFMTLMAANDVMENGRLAMDDGEQFGFADSLEDAAGAAGMNTDFIKMGWSNTAMMIALAAIARAAIEELTGRRVIGASRQIRATEVDSVLLDSADKTERETAHWNILTVGRIIANLMIETAEKNKHEMVLFYAVDSALKNITFAE